jgi:hypothetical protein
LMISLWFCLFRVSRWIPPALFRCHFLQFKQLQKFIIGPWLKSLLNN